LAGGQGPQQYLAIITQGAVVPYAKAAPLRCRRWRTPWAGDHGPQQCLAFVTLEIKDSYFHSHSLTFAIVGRQGLQHCLAVAA